MTTPAPTPAAAAPAANNAQSATQPQANANGAPAPTTAPGFASASLYVGDLNGDVSESQLFEEFNKVGPVASVRVCRDAATRRSLGYAYVNFHRAEDAERALNTVNFQPIRGRPCRIMWSHRDPSLRKSGAGNIFVNHLAKAIDNKQLYDTFSLFGNILSCKVATNAKGERLGYGFVHYETEEQAKLAIEKVDGKVIAGEKVAVSFFKGKKERGGANKNTFTNVFVKNLPGDITKDALDSAFSKFGQITSSVVNPSKEDSSKAFGFINFATAEEASAAVEGMNNEELQGRKLYVSRAQKKEEREKELRERFEQAKLERAKKYAGVNLFVKNLSDETDDEKLSQEFSKYGQISSVKVMRDAAGKSRGFGFVCFQSPEDATKAVTAMNGCMLDGKPLYVALAQRKEIRRQQLEAQYAARQKLGMGAPMGGMQPGLPYAANPMLFAGGMPQQRGQFMYPGQMPGRWNPQAGAPMMLGQMRGQPGQAINYHLMPVQGRGPMPQQGMPNQQQGRGPRQPRAQQQQGGMAPKMMHGGMAGMLPGQAPIRYADNVRNRGAAPGGVPVGGVPMMMPQPMAAPEMAMPAPHEPLTIKALAAAPEEMRKQMIGERLFPLIKRQKPNEAGKITGMLLEMDNGELIHLLESEAALNEKIQEAVQVLQAHPQEAENGEEAHNEQ